METIRVKSGDSYANINRSDYDASKHELYDAADAALVTDAGSKAVDEREALRQYEANRGVAGNSVQTEVGRNPSGTFSEPTPTDVRYPNKDATEFENNHGAFVGKSAAEMRAEEGLEDKPGGLIPEVHEAVQEATAAAATAADVATEAEAKADDAEKPTDLDAMTVPQLKQYAADHSIDLGEASLKADIRAAIDKA